MLHRLDSEALDHALVTGGYHPPRRKIGEYQPSPDPVQEAYREVICAAEYVATQLGEFADEVKYSEAEQLHYLLSRDISLNSITEATDDLAVVLDKQADDEDEEGDR